MSAPARSLPPSAPRRAPRTPVRKQAPRKRTQPRKAARRFPSGFVALVSVVAGLMILGLVTMNALLAQASFGIDDLSTKVQGLSRRYEELTREAATLSAPDRIAAWARKQGMRLPDEIHILHVPGTGPAAPVGASGVHERERLALKSVVEGQP